ncbi:MAG: hypothetical protein Q7T17_02015 [Microbacterium sp.]|uniref:hypothetical protein n=1 Tax=Microbacterium sp. TaxID=51671 RepID=UPI002724DBDB|nr:hypothetical protein [Microbacterium sp.]MDO8381749.1 hypothetical protein [Microbacterium sp.]
MNRRLIALALAATATFGLTACTGAGPESPEGTESSNPASAPESQTVEEACASVNDTIQSVSDDFEGVTAEQPEDAAAAFQAAADALGDASAEVGNAEVAALLPDIQAVFEAAGEAMTALAEGDATKVAELQNLGTDLQESFTAFQELCLE